MSRKTRLQDSFEEGFKRGNLLRSLWIEATRPADPGRSFRSLRNASVFRVTLGAGFFGSAAVLIHLCRSFETVLGRIFLVKVRTQV